MIEMPVLAFDAWGWVVIPFLIFLSRVIDVTIGTVRVIFISRGMKYLAPLAGFFEILVWLVAMGQIMQNLDNPMCYLAYAMGFSAGNFIGIYIAEKLSLGLVLIRCITRYDAVPLVEHLNAGGYGVTSVDGHGPRGPVKVVFTIVPRKEVEEVVEIIKRFNPRAFYTVGDVNFVESGQFPLRAKLRDARMLRIFRPFRKSK